MRRLAIEKRLKLNEYGVFRGETADRRRTEEEVYAALGLPYIPPELREDTRRDRRGARRAPARPDRATATCAATCRPRRRGPTAPTPSRRWSPKPSSSGCEYIAITDHTRSLAMTGGSDEKKLREQMAAIDSAQQASSRGFRVLKGAEVNINKDGTLDIDDEMLAELDVVGRRRALALQPVARGTDRARHPRHGEPARRHPLPPDRPRAQQREPFELDIDAVIAAAKRTGTVLEIDAYPDRLDLKDDHVRKAIAAGVTLVIDTDAHSVNHLRYLDTYGIATARRGWATKADVINTMPLDGFLAALKDRRQR